MDEHKLSFIPDLRNILVNQIDMNTAFTSSQASLVK